MKVPMALFIFVFLFITFKAFAQNVDEWMITGAAERERLRSSMSQSETMAIWNAMSLDQKLALSETNAALVAVKAGKDSLPPQGSLFTVNQWLIKGARERAQLRNLMTSAETAMLWNYMTLGQKQAMGVINQSLTALENAPTDLCKGYSEVFSLSLQWGNYDRILTSKMGGFAQEKVFVASLTVPTQGGFSSLSGKTSMAEYAGPPTYRIMTLSKQPCDFRTEDPSGIKGPMAATFGTTPILFWNVGYNTGELKPGETYYFNFKNYEGSCPQSSCEASIATVWPH